MHEGLFGPSVRKLRLCLGVAMILGLATQPGVPGAAQGYEPTDAEALIESCREKHQDGLDSGITAHMLNAMSSVGDCLEGVIDELTEDYF